MGAGLLLPAKRKPPSYLTTTRLTSHAACVTCILLSGDRVFTASKDRNINMWVLSQAQAVPAVGRKGAESGTVLAMDKPSKVFEGHSHWVTELLLEKSGCLLYSGGMDKTLRVWDVTNAVCLYTYCGHTDWLSGLCLVFSSPAAADAAAAAVSPFNLMDPASNSALSATPAPDYIMSSSHDGSLRFWQPYRPSLRSRTEEACLASVVLPGGGSITFTAACSVGVVCATNFGSIAFLPTIDPSNMQVQSARTHNGPITALSAVHWLPGSSLPSGRVTSFNSGGADLQSSPTRAGASSSPAGAVPVCFSGGVDSTVCMWALQPLRCLHKYEAGAGTGVAHLAFHSKIHLLTVAYEKGETLGWIDQKRVPLSIQLVGSVKGVVHAAHGGVVAAASSGVTLYHPSKGTRLVQLSDRRCSCLVYKEEAGVAGGRLAFAEEAAVVVCSGDVLQEAANDVAVRVGT
jgi:WD40 repeat protein